MYEQRFREGLIAVIKESGLKNIAVADKSGIKPDVFSKLLNGRRRIFADEMAAICHTLGMTMDEIIAAGEDKH